MQKGVNKVILVGRLSQDPEVRFMPTGNAVANINVVTSESWKDKQTGEQKEKAEFHRVVLFGKLAEVAGEYLRKGSQVYIEGQLQTRKYQDQQGQDRYTTEVVVQGFNGVMQMLGGRQGGQDTQKPSQTGGAAQQDNGNMRSGQNGGNANTGGMARGNQCQQGQANMNQGQQGYSEPPADFDDDITW